ncbi:MAG: hypothetical protein WDM89_15185 [Rhizomicrobium sp.]
MKAMATLESDFHHCARIGEAQRPAAQGVVALEVLDLQIGERNLALKSAHLPWDCLTLTPAPPRAAPRAHRRWRVRDCGFSSVIATSPWRIASPPRPSAPRYVSASPHF